MTTDELKTWQALNECEAVKKVFGGWEVGDRFAFGKEIQTVTDESLNQHRRQAVWIPPLYDPIRPERSLWGMSAGIREEWSVMQAGIFIASERPDLFLAEMIIEQEGE